MDKEESSQLLYNNQIKIHELNIPLYKWTYATLRRARSIRFLGRKSLDLASWLGVAGLRASDMSKLEKLPLAVVLRLLFPVMSKMDGVALCPLLPGVEYGEFFLHVPDW